MKIKIFEPRNYYKPFCHPWAYKAWETQQQIHWLAKEVSLADDVKDWNFKLTQSEKNLLTHIFRFFTQGDIEVNNAYNSFYLQVFKKPELQMMLTAFSNSETIHIDAYSNLLDTIGIPEVEYKAFLEYESMVDKCKILHDCTINNPYEVAKTIAVFSAFTEGLQLFSTFAILMSFQRKGKMKGMGQIVAWSNRDENLHASSMIKLFHEYVNDNNLDMVKLENEITLSLHKILEAEFKFIDLCFNMGDIETIKKQEVVGYILYLSNLRMSQLGFKKQHSDIRNPIPWINDIMGGVEHANFFENRPTEYSKASFTGNWSDVTF